MEKIDKRVFEYIAMSFHRRSQTAAEAIMQLTDMLGSIENLYVPTDTSPKMLKAITQVQDSLISTIKEFIADELKQQDKALQIYMMLTGIKKSKD